LLSRIGIIADIKIVNHSLILRSLEDEFGASIHTAKQQDPHSKSLFIFDFLSAHILEFNQLLCSNRIKMAETESPAIVPADAPELKTTDEQPVPEDTPEGNDGGKDTKKDAETATDATGESEKPEAGSKKDPIVSSSKKSRPPYKYDPDKITLRFLFANRDGLTVTIECNPSDTVGEVKAALLSVWPTDIDSCSGGDFLRLICMGKGYLMPDTRTLEDCQIPVFKTHPTPINVSVKPEDSSHDDSKPKKKKEDSRAGGPASATNNATGGAQVDQGCSCVIL